MFHESFECDGELDSNDEQHDGAELTIKKTKDDTAPPANLIVPRTR
ncbi:BnaA10g08210D [Brassica napus]|uniref:BnaA10g08210D protein n=1 Tax=Brassica napus TaxID=3708 RepID=A0A078HVB7_BRANA|nr:BnaA10g08210D [Brassica napus]